MAFLMSDRFSPGQTSTFPVWKTGDWEGSRYTIYRNPTVLPRAYVVPRAEVLPSDEINVMSLTTTPPRDAVLLSMRSPPFRRHPAAVHTQPTTTQATRIG